MTYGYYSEQLPFNCLKIMFFLVGRVFANGPGDRVIPKTFKMVLDAAYLNNQHYKETKGKVKQSKESNSSLSYTFVYLILKREPLGRSRLRPPT